MRKLLLICSSALLLLSSCGSSSKASGGGTPGGGSPTGTHELVGTFAVAAGVCSSATATPTGSFLQMLGGGGAIVKNSFGKCANADYTPLKPGSRGGLTTGSYEPNPTPPFAGSSATASQIFLPADFFGSNFGVSTNPVDPQTHTPVPPPSITSTAGILSGNVSSVSVAYNGAYFNQGSPKPDGTYPGSTKALTGTISCTGAFTIQWQSQIVGGAFNNFTGVWHLSGTFTPASGTAAKAVGCS
jgi:hypothetical protein